MKRAFTLTEMLIVLAIISILIGTMNVHVQHKKLQAEAKNIVECAKIYESAMSMYYLRNGGNFPTAELDADWTKNHLEDIKSLKPYCPTGFNTKGMIKSAQCKDITYFYMEIFGPSTALFNIFIQLEDNEELTDEIQRQLLEFAVPGQVTTTKTAGSFSVTFYIKHGSTVYI
ncbi:MAG: type II secretion system protein [bacterium]